MKKMLLAGVAALSVLSASAVHADDTTTCFVVTKTPDGFLAVRKKPSTKSEVIATLRPDFPLASRPSLQSLEDNEYQLYKNWTHWTRVKGRFSDSDADPSMGWVYNKYIREVPCEPEGESNEDMTLTTDFQDYVKRQLCEIYKDCGQETPKTPWPKWLFK